MRSTSRWSAQSRRGAAIDLNRLAQIASEGTKADSAINRAHDYVVQTVRGRNAGRKKGFIEVDGIGAGVLLIQRERDRSDAGENAEPFRQGRAENIRPSRAASTG